MTPSIEIVGFVAGTLVAVSLFPQFLKSWRTKSTRDIALSWSCINVTGQILWIYYGLQVQSASLVVMSSITLLMSLSLLVLKIRYG